MTKHYLLITRSNQTKLHHVWIHLHVEGKINPVFATCEATKHSTSAAKAMDLGIGSSCSFFFRWSYGCFQKSGYPKMDGL